MYSFAVMGNPIQHSQSPWIHEQFSRQYNIPLTYIKIESSLEQCWEKISTFRTSGGHGLNITMPFKQEAYRLSTHCFDNAAIAKAVNTIHFGKNADILGYNTDGIGLIRDITQNLKYSLSGKTIIILGAGGATQGILYPLLLQSPSLVIIANRTAEKAKHLANEFSCYGSIRGGGFESLADLEADLVLDATGFNSVLPFPDTFRLSSNSLCYDLKYADRPTPFMQLSKIGMPTSLSMAKACWLNRLLKHFLFGLAFDQKHNLF
jgi:shikimate dehydrogenase